VANRYGTYIPSELLLYTHLHRHSQPGVVRVALICQLSPPGVLQVAALCFVFPSLLQCVPPSALPSLAFALPPAFPGEFSYGAFGHAVDVVDNNTLEGTETP